jgi:hypothetical protein
LTNGETPKFSDWPGPRVGKSTPRTHPGSRVGKTARTHTLKAALRKAKARAKLKKLKARLKLKKLKPRVKKLKARAKAHRKQRGRRYG